MTLSPAEQAVVRAVVERGYLTPAQVDAALALDHPPGALAKLAERLNVEQVNALRAVYTAAQSTAPEAADRTLAPVRQTSKRAQAGPAPAPSSAGETVAPRTASSPARDTSARSRSGSGDLEPGTQIGDYRVVRELARGGMGVVYIAEHVSLARRVALKLLALQAGAEQEARFLTEARAAAKLRHSGIVSVHDVGAWGKHRYMVMDLIEGQALDDLVRERGPFEPREAVRISIDIARAVQHAHHAGILHRDIKPSNVLIRADGSVLLTDFGLARDRTQSRDGLTKTGEVMGTPSYMPPEQASGEAKRVDERADVYSLGATLFALLTGRPPFQTESLVSLLAKILRTPAPPPSSFRADLPAALDAVCLKCLAKEPYQRYSSAGALAEDLQRFLDDGQVEARVPSSSKTALVIALLAVLVFAGGLLVALATTAPSQQADAASPPNPPPEATDSEPETPAPSGPNNDPPPPEPIEGRVLVEREWAAGYGLTPDRLQVEWTKLREEGFMPVSLHGNPGSAGPRLSGVWRKNPDEHELRVHDTLEEAQRAVATFGAKGLLLYRFAIYGRPPNERRVHLYRKSRHRSHYLADTKLEEIDAKLGGMWQAGYSPRWMASARGESRFDVTGISYQVGHRGVVRSPPQLRGEMLEPGRYLVCAADLSTPDEPDRYYVLFFFNSNYDVFVSWQSTQLADGVALRNLAASGYLPYSTFEHGGEAPRRVTTTWARARTRARPTETGGAAWPALDAPVVAFAEEQGVAQAVLAVTRGDRLVHVRAFSRLPAGASLTQPESRFRLGTLSQPLSSSAVLRAVEQGRLRLDQTLAELLPRFSAKASAAGEPRVGRITLAQLVGRRAGWDRPWSVLYPPPAQPVDEGVASLDAVISGSVLQREIPTSPERLLDVLAELPLKQPPGEPASTSELGHLVLGQALASAHGDYAGAVSEHVLKPLGVRSFALGRSRVAGRLELEVGYDGDARADDVTGAGGVVMAHYGGFNLEVLAASRGWIASAPDVARWVSAFADPASGALLRPETYERMVREGLVWRTEGEPGDPRLWWTARMPGTFAHAERLPGGTGLVLLLNRDVDAAPLIEGLRSTLSATEDWPEHDLFERY